MKKSLLFIAICAILNFPSNSINAQSSCPKVVNSTFHFINEVANPCSHKISFDFVNPTSGSKRMRVMVTVNGIQIINECIDASGQAGVQRNFTSEKFTACNIAQVVVTIISFTGSSCGNSAPCANPLISIAGAPLPVTFSSFTAARTKDIVELKWQTSTETNNRGFVIEKNITGTWQEIAFVASQALNGNSTDLLTYSYHDMNVNSGMSQYRIRQMDIDGNYKYSDVRVVTGLGQASKTVLFPNPSNDGKVNIVFDATASRDITVVDMTGRIVRQYRSFSANSLQIANLGAGMYTVRANNNENGTVSIDKFVVAAR